MVVEEEHDKHLSTYRTEVVAGFDRIAASEIVMRNIFANLV